LPPVLGTALLILLGSNQNPGWLFKSLSHKPLVFVGLISYGWYLWHWPFLALYKSWNLNAESAIYINLAIVMVTFFIAKFSLEYVEKPIRYELKVSAKKAVYLGLAACVILYLFSLPLKSIEKQKYKEDPTYALLEERSSLRWNCID